MYESNVTDEDFMEDSICLNESNNYTYEGECAKKYYNLAGLDQYGNSYS